MKLKHFAKELFELHHVLQEDCCTGKCAHLPVLRR